MVLARLGYRLVRVRPAPPPESQPVTRPFFDPPHTNQVPGLGALYEFVFGPREHGTVVDVGAYDGLTMSNASCLIERGWSAVLVEPVSAFAEQCRQRYAGHPAVQVVEAACAAAPGTQTAHVAGGLSTLDADQLDEYRQHDWSRHVVAGAVPETVSVRTLDSILDECDVQPGFDVLSVDVEGYEGHVLAGFDLGRWRPRLMIWELQDTSPSHALHRTDAIAIADRIGAAGYRIVYKDPINTIFIRRDADLPGTGS